MCSLVLLVIELLSAVLLRHMKLVAILEGRYWTIATATSIVLLLVLRCIVFLKRIAIPHLAAIVVGVHGLRRGWLILIVGLHSLIIVGIHQLGSMAKQLNFLNNYKIFLFLSSAHC